ASKELDGSVMAMARKQNLPTRKAIQLLQLELLRKLYQQTHPRQRQRHRLQVKYPLQLRWKRRVRLPRHRLPLKIKLRLSLKETELQYRDATPPNVKSSAKSVPLAHF